MSAEAAAGYWRAAAAVDDAAEVRARAAAAAQDGWRGPARDAFDDDLTSLQRAAADLAADLRARAAALELAGAADDVGPR